MVRGNRLASSTGQLDEPRLRPRVPGGPTGDEGDDGDGLDWVRFGLTRVGGGMIHA